MIDLTRQLNPCEQYPHDHTMVFLNNDGGHVYYVCYACNTCFIYWHNGQLNGRYPHSIKEHERRITMFREAQP